MPAYRRRPSAIAVYLRNHPQLTSIALETGIQDRETAAEETFFERLQTAAEKIFLGRRAILRVEGPKSPGFARRGTELLSAFCAGGVRHGNDIGLRVRHSLIAKCLSIDNRRDFAQLCRNHGLVVRSDGHRRMHSSDGESHHFDSEAESVRVFLN